MSDRPAFPTGCAVLVAALVAGAPRAAFAEQPRASLVVTRAPGAEDCPDTAAVAARIRPLMGSEIVEATAEVQPDTWIQVELLRELAGYRAVISARGRRQGTRTIEDVSETCASIADALAITLVMLLDPEAASRPTMPPLPPPAPEPPERSALPASAPEPPERPPTPPSRAAAWVRPGVEANGGASIGVLHHASPLVEGGARLGLGERFVLAAGGGFVFPDRAPLVGRSVRLGLSYAYARGALRIVETPGTEIALVAGPLLGSLSGEGSGFQTKSTRHLLWSAAAAGGELVAALTPPFAWSARLLALVPLTTQGFSVDREGQTTSAFRSSTLGGLLTVGVSAAP